MDKQFTVKSLDLRTDEEIMKDINISVSEILIAAGLVTAPGIKQYVLRQGA